MLMNINLLLIGLIGLVANALILYLVIGSATRAHRRAQYSWAQLQLLARMAKIQGVPDQEIKEIFDQIP